MSFPQFIAILARRGELRRQDVRGLFSYPLGMIAENARARLYLKEFDYEHLRAWVYFLPREPAKARRLGGDYTARSRLRRSS